VTLEGSARLITQSGSNEAQVPDGQGVLRDTNSGVVVYNGSFENGFKSKTGTGLIFNLSKQYVGEYRGQWKYSLRHGYGELSYADGSVYYGEWRHDVQCGKGIEIDQLGSKYVGLFCNQVRHGTGLYTFADGTKELREYCNGILQKAIPYIKECTAITKLEKTVEDAIDALKLHERDTEAPGTLLAENIPDSGQEKPPDAKPLSEVFQSRRALKGAQEVLYPKACQLIQDAVGKEVPFEVDWRSFSEGNQATVLVWMLTAYDGAFTLMAVGHALSLLCSESLAKDVCKSKLKSISLAHRDKLRETQIAFKDGKLSIVASFDTGADAKLNVMDLKKQFEELL
jgi:hypothetical protein